MSEKEVNQLFQGAIIDLESVKNQIPGINPSAFPIVTNYITQISLLIEENRQKFINLQTAQTMTNQRTDHTEQQMRFIQFVSSSSGERPNPIPPHSSATPMDQADSITNTNQTPKPSFKPAVCPPSSQQSLILFPQVPISQANQQSTLPSQPLPRSEKKPNSTTTLPNKKPKKRNPTRIAVNSPPQAVINHSAPQVEMLQDTLLKMEEEETGKRFFAAPEQQPSEQNKQWHASDLSRKVKEKQEELTLFLLAKLKNIGIKPFN